MEERLNWLIIGVGAIGTYIGGNLILHGQKVAFLEQGNVSDEIIENGLRLNIRGQEHRILHPNIFTSIPEALAHDSYDISVLAVKAYDTDSIVDSIRPFKADFPPILCLQNGVDNEAMLEEVLGEGRVIAGTVTSAVSRRGPGDILLERQRGVGITSNHPLSSRLQAEFSRSGLNAHLYSSPASMKWSKMLTNLLANASSAILDMSPSQILSDTELYAVEIAQLREAIAVCQAQKIRIIDLPGTPVRLFTWAVIHLPPSISRVFLSRIAGKGRGNKMPSFHIDLYSGRGKCEVGYLNGAVVNYGEHFGVNTPVNRWLNQTLGKLINGSLPLSEYAHQPAKFLSVINAAS